VKVPNDVQNKVIELGKKVITEEASDVDIGEEGADWMLGHAPIFSAELLADWWRKRTRQWIYQQTRDALADGDGDAGNPLPFPELHAYLEVSPGVMKHQNVMTGKDWDNCLAMYENRKTQATVLFRQVKRCYDQVRPHLVADLTTADVIDRL
jgi:hypothetical protein